MNYIVDDIKTIVEAVSAKWLVTNPTQPISYMYGHRSEIANRLNKQSTDKNKKSERYPLVALRLDTSERVVGDMTHYTLNIAIVHSTKPGYTAEERYTNVFKPILYPLYDLFFQELRNVGGFWWGGQRSKPEHTKIDRPFYGVPSSEGNVKHLFTDPLDAIEIVDLKISKRIACD